MSKHKKPTPTIVPNTVEQQVKPNEVQILKIQSQRLAQEYQTLFQQAISYKESALKNALAVSNLARTVTGRLLDIETTDEKVSGQIKALIKELNKVEKPSVKVEQEQQADPDPV